MTTYDAHADHAPHHGAPLRGAPHHGDASGGPSRAATRLRWVLRANAFTSAAAGLVGLAAAPWCADQLGTQSVGWTRAVGVALIVFAIGVADASRAQTGALAVRARLISLVDASWVIASLVVGLTVDLTTAGRIVDAAQAVGVADFALLQWWLARRPMTTR